MKHFFRIFFLIAIIVLLYITIGPDKLKFVGNYYAAQATSTIDAIGKGTMGKSNWNNSPAKNITRTFDDWRKKLFK